MLADHRPTLALAAAFLLGALAAALALGWLGATAALAAPGALAALGAVLAAAGLGVGLYGLHEAAAGGQAKGSGGAATPPRPAARPAADDGDLPTVTDYYRNSPDGEPPCRPPLARSRAAARRSNRPDRPAEPEASGDAEESASVGEPAA